MSEAEYLEDSLMCAQERRELRELLNASNLRNLSKSELDKVYTQANFPRYPMYQIFQNKLIEFGWSAEKRKMTLIKTYFENADANVGEEICCPACGEKFTKKVYQQKFCGVKRAGYSTCKDFFFNWTNPKRYARMVEQNMNRS